ncbi:MAG: polyprenol monophosphomannose synthase [Bacteroidetes bacterium]|nr:MAG: polyprenol monophosphomannose synthase [Bacteroidota bacterium]
MNEILVIIPTYNEIENIEDMIHKVMSLSPIIDLLIVDDSSPDGTSQIVEDLQNKYQRLHLIVRGKKEGIGKAYIEGFHWAIKRDYNYICEMDADFSHNPDDIMKLYDTCINQKTDLAIGSRYVQGINVINWPLSRVLMSYIAGIYVRFITGIKIMDVTSGFKCYKKDVLEKINLNNIRLVGYGFQIEMKFSVWKHKFNITEVPIVFTDRTKGKSKMSINIFYEAFFGVIFLKIRSLFN